MNIPVPEQSCLMRSELRHNNTSKYPVLELDVVPVAGSTDIHPHTDWTDGMLSLVESADEAYRYGLWEKGAIEHGNPVDEDIDHPTTFLNSSELYRDRSYTSAESYVRKFENLQEIASDLDGAQTLTNADTEKLGEDLETIGMLEEDGEAEGKALHYKMILPHGVELDYNPATETASTKEEYFETVETYEKELIKFLKEAESRNSGYNYVLLSSHYVNTPFQPRYVKKDKLFRNMDQKDKGAVLKHYRDKEVTKIQSMARKLGEMSVPEVTEELMDTGEREQLQQFIYDQAKMVGGIAGEEIDREQLQEATQPELEIARPGPVAVGAHPTLIERNKELMDYFREHSQSEGDYPEDELRKYYKPFIKASEQEDNFIFEINGIRALLHGAA